jgi:type III secretion protein N (ATPase)
MDAVVPEDHLRHAGRIRELLSRYQDIELLVRIGEYNEGSDPDADEAIAKIEQINALLKQGNNEHSSFAELRAQLRGLAD